MTFFSSARERRLWLWTLAVVVAIYSTLGLARSLVEFLRERGLLDASLDVTLVLFVLGMILVTATVITQGMKTRPGGAEIVVALGITATYLLVFTRMAIITERSHLIEYGVLGILIHEALVERGAPGTPRPATAPARHPGDGGAGPARRVYPGVYPQPRLRPPRHPVQPARGYHGGGVERRAGVGAAAALGAAQRAVTPAHRDDLEHLDLPTAGCDGRTRARR